MFSKKFWKDAGEAFAVAAVTVLIFDADKVINADSKAALIAAAVGLGRAALVAGFVALRTKVKPDAGSEA